VGAFNTITGEAACPVCKQISVFRIQFKYGDKWQYEYLPGDTLKWGGNDEERGGAKHALVKGISEDPCPHCHSDDLIFLILIEENKLKAICAFQTFWNDGFVILD
jgi:hypothetical protein